MATSILNNGGNRQIQVSQPQIRKGFFQKVGEYLGVIPQRTAQKAVNRRDLYMGQTPQHLAVQRSMTKVVAGRSVPTSSVPKNQLDPQLLDFCTQVSKSGINV